MGLSFCLGGGGETPYYHRQAEWQGHIQQKIFVPLRKHEKSWINKWQGDDKKRRKTNGILGFLIELYFYDLFMQIIFTRTSLCVYEPISLQPSFDFISFDIVITRFCYTCFYLKVQSSRKTEITSVLQLYMAPDWIELTLEREKSLIKILQKILCKRKYFSA